MNIPATAVEWNATTAIVLDVINCAADSHLQLRRNACFAFLSTYRITLVRLYLCNVSTCSTALFGGCRHWLSVLWRGEYYLHTKCS
jgi:hypothetical protein